MAVILLLLGIAVASSGVATIGFGIPINEFTLGTTLILAGTTALTGGLILIGLSAAVRELGRLAEGLKTRPMARVPVRTGEAAGSASPVAPEIGVPLPAAPSGPRPATTPLPPRARAETPVREGHPAVPHPAPGPSSVDVSAGAIERLRSSIPRSESPKVEPPVMADEVPLSPNGGPQSAHRSVDPASEPKVTAEDRAGGAAVEALKASRLQFLYRSKSPRAAPQTENFDTIWPADTRGSRSAAAVAESQPKTGQSEKQADLAPPVEDRRSEPPVAEQPATAAVLKSGIVDGMAYTLYADGSIEAKLPQGTVRFGSIAELRAHIESNS